MMKRSTDGETTAAGSRGPAASAASTAPAGAPGDAGATGPGAGRTPAVSPNPKLWFLVVLNVFTVAWGGNQFTSMLVFYRGRGEFADLFVDSMLAIYAVGVGGALLIGGALTDHYGRRPIMLPAPALAIVGSLLIATGEHVEVLMACGRFVAGVALGLAMTAGGAWVKELSGAPFDPKSASSSGAKRFSMSFTLGLAMGPFTGGMLAQWAALPGQLIYVIHIVITLLVYPLMFKVPETYRLGPDGRPRERRDSRGSLMRDIAVPSLTDKRFLLIVLPCAPWVFGTSFTSQTILPTQIYDQLSHPVAYAGMISLITMGVGFMIQQFGPRIDDQAARGPFLSMLLAACGMTIAMVTTLFPSAALSVTSSVILGLAYGLGMYIGLAQTQRIAPADDLGGLTGFFYCATYVGMFFPALLTFFSGVFPYPVMLGFGIFMAFVCMAVAVPAARRAARERRSRLSEPN
ncbi:MFS transporter [Corynebacterium frankenforstense]|uniref:MFS transporter n=1 Tax=Corynebacterium frankenforstense TaxID=1230998 RepID=UPI001FE93629|nr:MFS transporter [Corynebacterium frankenforstense]